MNINDYESSLEVFEKCSGSERAGRKAFRKKVKAWKEHGRLDKRWGRKANEAEPVEDGYEEYLERFEAKVAEDIDVAIKGAKWKTRMF